MRYLSIVSLIIISSILNGCEQTRGVLGFNRNVNDEFAVATTAPLTLPPDFHKLPEPVVSPVSTDLNQEPVNKARDITLSQLSDTTKLETSKSTPGESDLLKNAKVDERDPNIRRTLVSEVKVDRGKEKSFVKDLLHINDNKGDVIDPVEEAERLKRDQSE